MKPELFNDWPVEEQIAYAMKMGWKITTEPGDTWDKIIIKYDIPVKPKKMVHAKLSGITLEEGKK